MPDDIALQLQQLMQQFQPSQEEIERAKRERMLAMSFGLLGTRKGQEFDAIGRAGLFGQGVYNDALGEGSRSRQQAMQAAAQALQLRQQMQGLQDQQTSSETLRANPFVSGGARSVSAPIAPGAVGGGGMGGGTPALFGGGSQPGPVTGPQQQQPADPVEEAKAAALHFGSLSRANPRDKQIRAVAEAALKDYRDLMTLRKTSGGVQTMRGPDGKLYGVQGMEYEDPRRVEHVPAEKIDYVNTGGAVRPSGSLSGQLLAPELPVTNTPAQIAQQRNAEAQLALSRSADARAARGENAPSYHDGQLVYKPTKEFPTGRAVTPEGITKPPKAAPEGYTKAASGILNFNTAINEYLTELKGWNSLKMANPTARALMGSKYKNLMLQAKEAYNLGVLAGPDVQIIETVVTDPLSFSGAITPTSALDTQSTELQRIMQQNASNLAKVYNQPAQQLPQLPRSPREATGRIGGQQDPVFAEADAILQRQRR